MDQHKDILEKCKQGKPAGQRMLFDLYKAKLMGLARRYTKNRDEAQDILQEAFVKIFRGIHQLESGDKLEGWLVLIVIRTAINYYHSNKRYQEIFTTVETKHENDQSFVYQNPQPFSDEYILSLVSALPDGCRVIFNLCAIEGYSHAEIAETLGISESTSRSQFHYARSVLKTKLRSQDVIQYYEKFA